MVDAIGLFLGILGVIPLAVSFLNWLLTFRPVRNFLSFQDKEPLDIILTTSNVAKSERGAPVVRATTGVGQVQGVAQVARMLGRFYRRKEIRISLSKLYSGRPNGDIVLLGGPAKNEFTREFLGRLISQNSAMEITFDDDNGRIMFEDISVQQENLEVLDGVPRHDYAVVVLWHNPFAVESRRAILCAGLTSYGTIGACQWLFDDLLLKRNRIFGQIRKTTSRDAGFICLLRIDLISTNIINVEPMKIVTIGNNNK